MVFTIFKSKLNKSFKEDLKNIKYFIGIVSNIGCYSLCAVKSPNCNVISVEPKPDTFINFLKNIKIYNFSKRIIPINFGISTKMSSENIISKSSCDKNNLEFISIEGYKNLPLSMDDLILKVPKDKKTAIKIDLEGLEESVILSGQDSLINRKEIKLIYKEILNNNILNIENFLKNFRFKCIKNTPKTKSEYVNSIYQKID